MFFVLSFNVAEVYLSYHNDTIFSGVWSSSTSFWSAKPTWVVSGWEEIQIVCTDIV